MEDCTYCGVIATTRDHFIPWSYNSTGKRGSKFKKGKENNIFPACMECNKLAGDKVFETVDVKREYIQERIEKKYKKLLNMPDWSAEELKELSIKLRNNTILKMKAKHWTLNRIAYPTIIYMEQPLRAELRKIQKLFGE